MKTIEEYEQHLSRLPLSPHTKRNYLLRVKQFLQWLEGCPEGHKAVTNPVERDFAVRDYKCYLLQAGNTSNSVNAALTALDSFYMSIGLGAARAKRQELPQLAPRALEPDELRRFIKSVAQCKSLRNRTIALLLLHCGLRISEVHHLNVADVLLSARKRELIVRCGKNNKRRVVPINKDAGEALQAYLSSEKTAQPDTPLFGSRKGSRLSVPAIDRIIRALGAEAGVELSCHSLRHTCLTRLVRAGVDLVTVAAIGGHSRLETTRRYTLPTAEVMVAAMESLNQAS